MGHAGHFILAPLLAPWKYRHHIMKPVHALLMVSNILIIVGGAMLSNAYDVTDAQPLTSATDQENTAKVLRTVGSAVFLGAAVFWSACLFKTIATNRSEGSSIHSTLVLLVIAGAFLIARGTFGMLQSCLYSVSFFLETTFQTVIRQQYFSFIPLLSLSCSLSFLNFVFSSFPLLRTLPSGYKYHAFNDSPYITDPSSSKFTMLYTFGREAAAATVFLVAYTLLFMWMVSGYVAGRYKLRSRWSLLMFHVTVRVASQVRDSSNEFVG